MKKNYITLKMMAGYLLILLFMLMSSNAFGQSPCDSDDICVVQFNASDAKAAAKYKIVVVPTILIFSDGEEVGRFQANIMMQMEAKKKDVQEKIEEIIMEGM